MGKNFCHLHCHTEYSLLDGIIRIEKLMEHLKEQGMTSCAITDHGNLSGAIEFYSAAKKAGIHPILGCEVYVTQDQDICSVPPVSARRRDNNHLVLLAQNNEGWHNLVWLVSNAALNNFYYKPRVSPSNLIDRSRGLICLSACLKSPIAQAGKWDEDDVFDPTGINFSSPIEELHRLKKTFPGRFYAEIQDHPFKKQQSYNEYLIEAAKDARVPLVITTDAHFLREEDYDLHQLVVKKFNAQDAYNKDNHIRSPDEMFDSAVRLGAEEAFWNTMKIAQLCDVELKLGEYQAPLFDIEQCDDYQDYLRWKNERGNN